MVTDRATVGAPRACSRALTAPRLLWLAALLFGLLYAHGLNGESAGGHLDSGVAAVVTVHDAEAVHGPASASADRHEDHDSPAHPDQACAVGQPDHGVDVWPPCAGVLESAGFSAARAVVGMSRATGVSPAHPRSSSMVLRI
ncbi:hypothetical protein ACIHCQ_29775 [Streptomyces sp. NPDC052236]|uniref:hypothetical protein n=1 Tax=Streptomyces sp. NPDC052236 TaxID=3365686 RepID=UPI0037D1A6BE